MIVDKIKFFAYFKYFKQKISGKVYLLFLLMFVGAAFEMIGIGLLLPLIMQDKNNEFYVVVTYMLNYLNIGVSNINITIFILLIFTLKFFLILFQNFFIYEVSYGYMNDLKRNLIEKIFQIDYLSFLKIGIDKINNIMTKEIEKASFSIRYILQLAVNLIYTVSYLMLTLYINYKIVIVALLVGLIVVFLQRKITNKIILYSNQIVLGNDYTNLLTMQILQAFKYLAATNNFKKVKEDFLETSKQYSQNGQNISFFNSIPKVVPEFIGIIMISILMIVNEIYFHEKTITVVFLGLLLYRLLSKILGIQKSYQDCMINVGSIDRVISIENYCEENKNLIIPGMQQISKVVSLDFMNVTLEIERKMILNNITCTFFKGKTYAIVGLSGSGKTSFLNMITMLYKHKLGKIQINKKDLFKLDINDYRSKIGYVSQETVIFEGSVKENILFGNKFIPDKFNNIVKLLDIEDLICKELIMGGTNISGGQRQRISIARELYRKPEILILDESTSALDANIEKQVMNGLLQLRDDIIIIVVAHRLSTLVDIDEIFVLKDGVIQNKGTMREMYLLNKEFKTMCNNQNIIL